MRIIIDSNILLTYFWKSSQLGKILRNPDWEFYSPEFALSEIKKHTPEIIKKANLLEIEFNNKLQSMVEVIEFVPFRYYSNSIKSFKSIFRQLSDDLMRQMLMDIDFLALADVLSCPIWSNDKAMNSQQKIRILTTEEMILLSCD